MLEYAAFAIILAVAILVITGYDNYIAAKLSGRLRKASLGFGQRNLSRGTGFTDKHTQSRIKGVKAVKIGSYLVVTLVISDAGGSGEEIVIDDPSMLIPLISVTGESEELEEVTS